MWISHAKNLSCGKSDSTSLKNNKGDADPTHTWYQQQQVQATVELQRHQQILFATNH